MRYENQLAYTSKALSELLEAIALSKDEESDEGQKVSVAEFDKLILPKYHLVKLQMETLYMELVAERGKENQTLINKCVRCEKRIDRTCELFASLSIESWSDFEHYAERNNSMCIYQDFDKPLQEGFCMPDGEMVKMKGKL